MIEANILYPKVAGDIVGLHPLVIIIALFIGAEAGCPPGAVRAVLPPRRAHAGGDQSAGGRACAGSGARRIGHKRADIETLLIHLYALAHRHTARLASRERVQLAAADAAD